MALNNLGLGMTISAKDAASAVFNQVGQAMAGSDKQASNLSLTLDNLAGRLTGVGNQLLGMGRSALAGLGKATDEASKFGQGITEVGTLVDHAKFSVADMESIAKKMATTFGGDLATQTAALYQAISSGADTASKATNLLAAANQLAIAGHTDQKTAVTGLTKVLNNYNLGFERAAEVSDAFFVAVRGGQTTVGELGNVIGELAAGAKGAGVSYEELIAAFGTGATLMRDTASAGTGLKAILQGIAHPTQEATEEAKRLGIVFSSKGLRDAGGFEAFMKKITSSSKFGADSLNQLFSSLEAANAVTALTANGGAAYSNMLKDMGSRAGLTAKAFEEMSGQLEMQGAVLKANTQVALVEIGKVLVPIVKEMTALATRAVQFFISLPEPVKRFLVGIVAVAAAVAVFAGAVIVLTGVILGLAAGGEAFLVVAAGLTSFFEVFAIASAVAGVAIAGFRRAFDQNIGGIGAYFADTTRKVKLAYDALTQLFTDGGFSGAVLDEFGKTENQGVEAFATQIFLVFNRVASFLEGISSGFSNALTGMNGAFGGLVSSLSKLGAAFGFVQDGPTAAASAFDRFGQVGSAVGKGLAGVFEFLVKVITAAVDIVVGFGNGFRSMGPVFTMIGNALGSLLESFSSFGGILGDAGDGAATSTSAFQKLGEAMGTLLAISGYVAAGVLNMVSTVVSVIGSQIGAVVGFLSAAYNGIKASVGLVVALLTGDWAGAWANAKKVAFSVVQAVVSLMVGLLGTIAAVVDGIGKAFGTDLGIKNAVEGGAKDAMKDFGKLIGLAPGASPTPAAGGATPSAAPSGGTGVGSTIITTMPGVPATAAAAGAAPAPPLGGALPALAPTPVVWTSTTIMKVGEEELTRVVEKRQTSDVNRGFGPIPQQT